MEKVEPLRASAADVPSAAAPQPAFSDVDVHRVDLAARILALKQHAGPPEVLIAAAGQELARVAPGERNVLAAVVALIRCSAGRLSLVDDVAGAEVARRAQELLAALTEPADAASVRGLLRGGGAERRLGLGALRRIRRALRLRPAEPPPGPPLIVDGAAWDELLDGLARSLAIEREAEVLVDLALAGEDAREIAARVVATRQALQQPEPPALPRRETWAPQPGDPQRTLADVPRTTGEPQPIEPGRTIGRFTVLHRLGAGAMGVVYAAYDPELDRKIALKVLRVREGPRAARAHARLQREAQAMARLSHPNVAVVHDVGTHHGDVFVAMEFIRGLTLQAWTIERKPGWQEIVEVFMQAGQGLAAAHAAGLVHRDFKPANAMLGDDGRVRVLDFGLCYSNPTLDVLGEPRQGEVDVRLTRREEVVGTPAYMPPEQFHGEAVGHASDQFSFCASLYEALYGQLPFAGETPAAIAYAVSRGELRSPPRSTRVPAWLHAIVVRGLRPEIKDRFASMDELLRALDRRRSRGRATAVAALGLAALAGVGGYALAPGAGPAEDPCSGGAREIGAVWTEARRAATETALNALGPAFSQELWPQVEGSLDRYTADWQAGYRRACEAHRRGEHSGALLDRRVACLAQRKVALDEAIAVLTEANAEVGLRALEIVRNLPGLERCDDLPALEADVPPPGDPAVRAAIAAWTPKLERARTLERAGRQQAALDLADVVVAEAEVIGDRPTVALALLERARMSMQTSEAWEERDVLASRAYLTALGVRADEIAAEALTLRMYLRGISPGQLPRARDDLEVARELIQRLPSPARLRGLFLNNASAVRLGAGDVAGAEALLREALAVREAALGPDHLDTALTLTNLAMVVPQADERERLTRRALAITEAELGSAHPQTIELRIAAAARTADPRQGVDLLRRGCAAIERFAAENVVQRTTCLSHLGEHAEEAGDASTAGEARRQAAALLERIGPGDPTPYRAEVALIRGHAALLADARGPAIEALRAALADQAPGDEWWQRALRAEIELCLGLLLLADGHPAAARDVLASAVDQLNVPDATAQDLISVRRLNRARVALARALLAGEANGNDVIRATAELAGAERWYAGAGEAFAWRLAEIAAIRVAEGLR